MVYPDVFSKQVVSLNVKGIVVKAVDIGNQFKNEQEFEFCEHILQWIRAEASKLGFGMVIRRFDNGSDIRCAFVTMAYKRSGKYITPLQNFIRDDTGSRKCECPIKLCAYMLAKNKCIFNVVCGLHNHDLCQKLVSHLIVCRLTLKEKECIADMTLNLVQQKSILATLKCKRSENISNIKHVYNIYYQTNKALRGDITEMQQLLKLLDDNNYVFMYRTCEDGVTIRYFGLILISSSCSTCFLQCS
ncbi:uncharacterized protein LOC127094676 [Lathyrus oleraceus]|uniref:uncharacterized protein LOC127094676 n=1 Tax=Pisum sativum TaxID=3888 RepID=UPI0021D2920B|nr:uncharacterized protein LOC127094676 [Pisum sativum]